jgi:hypothetical protein
MFLKWQQMTISLVVSRDIMFIQEVKNLSK